MELQSARQIIDTLAQGIHPVTGEVIPDDSPYSAAPVLRALFTASKVLGETRARRALPANTGKPWSAQDDGFLLERFTADADLKELARELERSTYAVQARLVKLGRLEPRGAVPF
jgi:hypothetical protein